MDQVGCRLSATLLHICAGAVCCCWFDRNEFPFSLTHATKPVGGTQPQLLIT